ncbi:IQ and ubiquitin-like domain-containing protein [Actinidia chinensis var. chinensis]|uniref:IQ and ubiquitin-like domain-containing protein n=1 Tax=Actinidia chinensis var. chinensis TaxID=1590841 RepID=A0A2R6QP29_ACTCC|nr:IQ and ubiquitin-like domain-containing protein [Actinidia chinensis var. chinensis]
MALLVPSVEVSSVSGNRLEFTANYVSQSVRNVRNQIALNKNRRGGDRVRVRVCSRIKDSEVGVSDLRYNLGLYGLFSALLKLTTKSLPKTSKEDEEKQNYHVNTGYAIRTLREEFPELFYKELAFDSYRDDIVFKDPLNTFVGIENYKSIFWALRFHGRIFFRALWLDIVSVWQPSESIIMVRWTAHGIPRVPWESRGRFDGTSEYKLDKYGKIYEHRVHNIALNAPPRFRVISVDELIQSIGCPPQHQNPLILRFHLLLQ